MSQDLLFWVVMCATGLANFLGRFVMFSGVLSFWGITKLPDWVEHYLAYVPTAVLSAMIAASLFVEDSSPNFDMSDPRLLAAAAACAAAIVTKSVLATIGVGLGLLWVIG